MPDMLLDAPIETSMVDDPSAAKTPVLGEHRGKNDRGRVVVVEGF